MPSELCACGELEVLRRNARASTIPVSPMDTLDRHKAISVVINFE